MAKLVVPVDHALRFLPSYVKPFAGVGQIFILDSQVFGQYAFAVGKSVGVWAEQPIFFVLVLVVTVAGSEYVVVELHHRYDTGVKQILGASHSLIRVLPYPCKHVGAVYSHISHYSEPFLKMYRKSSVINGL